MPITNALLIRYRDGYTESTDATSITANGRREGFLSAGNQTTAADAQFVASERLAAEKDAEVEITVGLEPVSTTGVDLPYYGFGLGDIVSSDDDTGTNDYRVVGFTVREDEDGHAEFVPELSALEDYWDVRADNALRRMSNGTLGGRALAASPTPDRGAGIPTGKLDVTSVATFSWSAEVAVEVSGPFVFQRTTRLTKVVCSCDPAKVRVGANKSNPLNGTMFQTVTIPSGSDFDWDLIGGQFFTHLDYLQIECTSVGTGHTKLTVEVFGTTGDFGADELGSAE
jgi:hypothetical protein